MGYHYSSICHSMYSYTGPKSKQSDCKTVDYLSFKVTNLYFHIKYICNFLAEKWKVSYQNTRLEFDYRLYWTFKIAVSPTGFEWGKRGDLLVSRSFLCCDLSVRLCSSKGYGLSFPLV